MLKKKYQCYVTQFLNPGKKMIKRDIVPTLSEIPFLDNDRKTKLKVKKQIKIIIGYYKCYKGLK